MHYQTIVLELLQSHPTLQANLKSSNSLLSTMNQMAANLRSNHLDIIERLTQERPHSSKEQLSSEAMEIAVHELQDTLQSEEESDPTRPLSLAAAMHFLKAHTPKD